MTGQHGRAGSIDEGVKTKYGLKIWSQWPGLNRRPTVYETVALPLSYIGLTKPSAAYFASLRANGKRIRSSLETRVVSVAKLKLPDFLQDQRRMAVNAGEPVNGDAIIEMFKKKIENQSLADTAKRVPKGVVCLLSALRFHGLKTENPGEVCIAIHRGA